MTPQTQFTTTSPIHCVLGESLDGIYICNADGIPVAKVLHEETEAFGDVLVDRYNSAPSLYAALQATVKSLEWVLMAMPDIPNPSEFRNALEEAKKALDLGSSTSC